MLQTGVVWILCGVCHWRGISRRELHGGNCSSDIGLPCGQALATEVKALLIARYVPSALWSSHATSVKGLELGTHAWGFERWPRTRPSHFRWETPLLIMLFEFLIQFLQIISLPSWLLLLDASPHS